MHSLSNVIFIAYLPLTERFIKDFYVNELEEAGFKTEYWNVSTLFNLNIQLHGEVGSAKVTNILTYKQLRKKIEAYSLNSLFIFNITYSGRVLKLFRVFAKQNCLTATFARGTLPYPSANYSLLRKFFFKFKTLKNSKYVRDTILNQTAIGAKRLNMVKPYNYIFYAGSAGVSNIGYGYKFGLERSKLIPVNSFDYDNFLSLEVKECQQVTQPYCVFLDGYLPYHPDFKLLGLPQINSEKYYFSLNNFFSLIEDKYNLKVIIAAHPKSNYDDKNPFDNRPIIKNKTAELTKYADFIISHASTSISFAILFKKPLLFIYTNEIKKVYPFTHYQLVMHFSKILNTSNINIDDHLNDIKISPVDIKSYYRYKYNYLTSPESERQFSSDIFIHTLISEQTAALPKEKE